MNRYGETPQAIPLQQSYTFLPSPMDGTLKAMLERWARDSNTRVSYGYPSDFTLHSAVAKIRTDDLQEAVSQLSEAYAPQGIVVMVDGNHIVVREAAHPSAGIPAPAAGTP